MANKHMKICSTSLREMQILTMRYTMRYHLLLVRMLAIKMSTNNKCWTWNREKEPSYTYTAGGNANYYSHYGEQCGDSLKNWK